MPNSTAFDIRSIVRANILALHPYRCARDDYSSGVLLDANENPHGPCLVLEPPQLGAPPMAVSPREESPSAVARATKENGANPIRSIDDLHLNRYPDPYQLELKGDIAKYRRLPNASYLFTGVGSDEAIDLLMRVFCVPGHDAILACSPTYGMYRVSANTNDVSIVDVPLTPDTFQLETDKIVEAVLRSQKPVKLLFLCSPGNPTGAALRKSDLLRLLNDRRLECVIVVDEAYIDFVQESEEFGSMIPFVERYPNLVVLQTLSKSFGLAGIRYRWKDEDITFHR